MKRDKKTQAPTEPPPKELITVEPPSAKLCILIRVISNKRSRCAKLDGGGIIPTSKGGVFAAKIVHVGMVAMRTVTLPKGRVEFRWFEAQNLAEFDGPTSEDAAHEFVRLLPTRTAATDARCIADGPITKPACWKQRGKDDATIVRHL